MEMAPLGNTAFCQQVDMGGMVDLELTGLAILWTGIAVPCSVCTSAARYPVTIFIALIEAVAETSVSCDSIARQSSTYPLSRHRA
jgi:hypothetical protein